MERSGTGSVTRLIQGLVVGAAAMYYLDPDKGRRRRALARDQIDRVRRDVAELAREAARDSTNRLQGVRARVDRRSRDDESLDELRLIERVRSAIGRVASHPHAIQVGALGGNIRLSGPVLADEVPALIACVHGVAGVHGVENQLDVHERADIPALQGQRRARRGQSMPTPAMRMLTLLGGGALALRALRSDGLARLIVAGAAVALARRALYGTGNGLTNARGDGDVDTTQAAEAGSVIHAGRPVRGNGSGTQANAGAQPPAMLPPATH